MWGAGTVLYTMLMGEPPFSESSISKLMVKVMNADYNRSSEQWHKLSKEAQELIQSLLCVDPTLRLTPSESLNSSWF